MTSTVLLKTAQRKRSQVDEDRRYVDKDDIRIKSQNKEKFSVDQMHPMTSYVHMCCERARIGSISYDEFNVKQRNKGERLIKLRYD